MLRIFFNFYFIGAYYYDPDNDLANNSLGVAILYHKSSENGFGRWEYSMPQNPTQFRPIPEDSGWPSNEQLPEVSFNDSRPTKYI